MVIGSNVNGEELIGLYIFLRDNLPDVRVSFCNQVCFGRIGALVRHWLSMNPNSARTGYTKSML